MGVTKEILDLVEQFGYQIELVTIDNKTLIILKGEYNIEKLKELSSKILEKNENIFKVVLEITSNE